MRSVEQITDLEIDAQTRLCRDLDHALHAMAQPLTVLRGTLSAISLRRLSARDTQRYLQVSSRQVERLCRLMGSMRQLLDRVPSDTGVVPPIEQALQCTEAADAPVLPQEESEDREIQNHGELEQALAG